MKQDAIKCYNPALGITHAANVSTKEAITNAVQDIIEKEFNVFHKEMLNSSIEVVFDAAEEIVFKTHLSSAILDALFDERIKTGLEKFWGYLYNMSKTEKNGILDYFYHAYLKDCDSVMDPDVIYDFIVDQYIDATNPEE